MGTLVGNVRLDTEVDERQVFDGVVGRIDAADEAEAAALMDLRAELVQLHPELGEWESVARHMLAVESEA